MGYLGELWRLWRGRRDNPLCRYGGGRRGWMVLLHGVVLLIVIGVLFLTYLVPVLTVLSFVFCFVLLFFIGYYLFVYFTFLLCTSRWWTEQSLTDLYLSSLSAKEVAFGMVYPAVKHSLFALVYFISGIIFLGIILTRDSGGIVTLSEIMPIIIVVVFGLLPVLSVFCIIANTHQWIMQGKRPIRIFFESLLNTVTGVGIYGVITVMTYHFLASEYLYDEYIDTKLDLTNALWYLFATVLLASPVVILRWPQVKRTLRNHWMYVVLLLILIYGYMVIFALSRNTSNLRFVFVVVSYLWVVGFLFVYPLVPNLFRFVHDRVYFSLDPNRLRMKTMMAPGMIRFLRQKSLRKGIGWITGYFGFARIFQATIKTVIYMVGMMLVLYFLIQVVGYIKYNLGISDDNDYWGFGYWVVISYPFSYLCAAVLPCIFVSSLLKKRREPLLARNRYQIMTILLIYALVPTTLSIIHLFGFNLVTRNIDAGVAMLFMVGMIIIVSLMATITVMEKKTRRLWSLVWGITGLIMVVSYHPYIPYQHRSVYHSPSMESNLVSTVFIVAVCLFLVLGIPRILDKLYRRHLPPEEEEML